jgi:4-amino-4-deoxychorismate lyase
MNLVNGKPSSSISIFDRGFLYGDGLFESILVIKKNPINIALHLKRLKNGCRALRIKNLDLDLLNKHIKNSLEDQINCVLNINITRGTADKRGYDIKNCKSKPNIIITTSKIPIYPEEYKKRGIKTKFTKQTFKDSSDSLAKIKHLNRLEQVLATEELSKTFPELIVCDNYGNIIEGISSNIFFIKEKVFYTPDIKNNGVDGVMKSYITSILKKHKYKIKIENINKKEIKNFDGAFFCNSIRLIWKIKSINSHKYKDNTNINNLIKIIENDIKK